MLSVANKMKQFLSLGATRWLCILIFSSTLILSVSFIVPSAIASDDSEPSPVSYWGPIPAPADSVTSIFTSPPRPLWESTLIVPYKIVTFPLSMLQSGLKSSFIYIDEHGIVYRVSRLLRPQEGPFGLAVRIEAGSLIGLGGGLTATHNRFFSPDNQLKLRWSSTSKGAHKVTLGLQFAQSRPFHVVAGAGYRLRPESRYFGLGPVTTEQDETHYTQETSWIGLSLRRSLPYQFTAALTSIYSGVGTRGISDDDHLSLQDLFLEYPRGFRDHSEGITVSFDLRHETTTESGRPQSGGIREIKLSRFTETQPLKKLPWTTQSDRSDFWTARVNLEQMIPLWHTNRALALRAHCTWLEPDHSGAIPFQRLLTNDDPDLLRGYRDFRWRDRGLLAMSVEYRWPLWSNKDNHGLGVDSYLFSDIGEAFGEFEQISADHLTTSFGWGLRLIGNNGFLGRFEIGISEEETVIRVRTDQIFQFSKGGLQHGRDQVALR